MRRAFVVRCHRVVRSSSLVSANNPTRLFTNAGPNQSKGDTRRHHTFFQGPRGSRPSGPGASERRSIGFLQHPRVLLHRRSQELQLRAFVTANGHFELDAASPFEGQNPTP